MGTRTVVPLQKVTVRPSNRAMHAQGTLVCTRSSTAASSNSGVMRSERMCVFGTLSSHTVCQMPLCGVYQMPPRAVFCFPRV